MQNKSANLQEVISKIPDNASLMIGGFGRPGTPFTLIDELAKQGQKGLTLIKNDASEIGLGIGKLLQNGQVKKIIASHIGLNPDAVSMMNSKEIEVEFVPQGILAERIRSAGTGMAGFLTDVGMDTLLAKGKQIIKIEDKNFIFEKSLAADFALLHAQAADTIGNLIYDATAQNFNPLMAMAAKTTIVEAKKILKAGEIKPEFVHTPAPFIDHIILLKELPEVYGIAER